MKEEVKEIVEEEVEGMKKDGVVCKVVGDNESV